MNPLPAARVILHVDMDAFYAAVEIRENPSLAGKPLIIGHRGPRGVVSTCSYEARRYGVRSAMPSVTAERLCPGAVWLPGRMELYTEVSRAIRAIFHEITPVVEPVSVDEAFLDLTGIARDLGHGAAIARKLKQRIVDEHSLTASVGVAPNKFLAKIASDLEKPDGLTVIAVEDVPGRLWPLPVRAMWGVGPKTAERLEKAGVRTIGDLAALSLKSLEALAGPTWAAHLHALAHGRDDRAVETHHEARSISEERTYARDLTDPDVVDRQLVARAERVAQRLRGEGLVARTVQIKVRTGDFKTLTRARTLPEPTDLAEDLLEAARSLMAERVHLGGKGIRLLGLAAQNLEPRERIAPELFPDPRRLRLRRVAAAADAVRARLGPRALTRARLVEPPGDGASPRDDEEASSPPALDPEE